MNYRKFTDLIIDNIEGGYYHPDMKSKLKNGDKMLDSGETLFGMDRKNGGNLMQTATGQKFWALVDSIYSSHHADTAYYNNKPTGSAANQLRALAAELMKSLFIKYYPQYLSTEAQRIVNNSDKLLIHFFYACWNGITAFKKYAEAVNNAVAAGKKN